MAAVTAQILIGNPHRNDGGLREFAKIEVSEGSRPGFVLSMGDRIENPWRDYSKFVVWVPSLENAMDDALLMVAIHVMRSPEILELVNQINPCLFKNRVEVYSDISPEDRQSLYRACQALDTFPKIVASIYRGSFLSNSSSHLKHYKMDAEICMSVFCREYSAWGRCTDSYGDPDFKNLSS